MAWTAGVTRTTGDLITAAQWNSFLGAAGSLDFVHDALDDVTGAEPTRALNTIYQNTSGKIRLVIIEVGYWLQTSDTVLTGDSLGAAKIGSASPPTTVVATVGIYTYGITSATSGIIRGNDAATFIVPPGYYYKLETSISGDGQTPVLHDWYEWDLL